MLDQPHTLLGCRMLRITDDSRDVGITDGKTSNDQVRNNTVDLKKFILFRELRDHLDPRSRSSNQLACNIHIEFDASGNRRQQRVKKTADDGVVGHSREASLQETREYAIEQLCSLVGACGYPSDKLTTILAPLA